MPLRRAQPPALLALEFFMGAAWPVRLELLQGWAYRFGVFGAMNLLDDPAWLALVFC